MRPLHFLAALLLAFAALATETHAMGDKPDTAVERIEVSPNTQHAHPRDTYTRGGDCVIGGCSGQLCVEAGSKSFGTCEYLPQYACYPRLGTCARQSDGTCGWTPSSALQDCLKNPLTPTN
jgi:hypothetical protein